MNRQHFTMNPATPHPDSDSEPAPMPLNEAIEWAIKVLRDQNADQWTRRKAADELQYSYETQEAPELLPELIDAADALKIHCPESWVYVQTLAAIEKATP